jgi:hypothetical protein
MTEARLLKALFARFGVTISDAEAATHEGVAPREAILMLLADREIAARFDTAHGRPPDENDIDALLDIYLALVDKDA